MTTFLARYPFEFGPGALHFCRVKGKIRGMSAPKQTSAETMWIGSLGPRMFGGTRATNFSTLHNKNGGCRTKNFRHRGQIQTGTVPKKILV